MGSPTTIRWTGDDIPARIAELGPKLDAAVGAVMEYHAPRVQSYARENAPWNDQTGNARQGLFAEAYGGGGGGRDAKGRFTGGGKARGIVLYHSVPYGIWLEVRWSGRYRIIVPTIERKAPEVFRTIEKLMRKL